jgi:hypothetical protein
MTIPEFKEYEWLVNVYGHGGFPAGIRVIELKTGFSEKAICEKKYHKRQTINALKKRIKERINDRNSYI